MLKLSNLKIDQEFEAQISPLSFDELQQLELNILRDRRLVDPIIVWNGYILDGHNRYAILRKHTFIEYEIRELEFASRQEALVWICNHQLGRRNLTPERKKFLIGKRYEAEKQIDSNRGNQYTSSRKDAGDQIDPQQNRSSRHVTRQRIAKETNTSEGYVQRAEKYMHGVEAAEDAVPGSKEEILSGHIKATDREICALAKIPEPQRPEAVAELQKPKKERDKSILSALPETAADQDTFDPDGRRFVTGIAEKIQGEKKKLSKEDWEALKKSVDGRYYREASSDGSLVLCDIQGAHDDFINRWENVFRNYPDTLTEAKNWTFIEKHLDNLQRYLEFVRTKRQKVLKNCSSTDDAAFAD